MDLSYLIAVLFGLIASIVCDCPNGNCCDQHNCEYHVFQKLLKLEEKVATLTKDLEAAEENVAKFQTQNEKCADRTTYIRWGRTSCPGTASLVYNGYAAGGHYSHSGSAVNPLCLPMDPIFDDHKDGFQDIGKIYGAEYRFLHHSFLNNVNDEDIPCAVCRIPRNNVIMVPGRNVCHANYILEYTGYLVSGYHGHRSSSEYICVDKNPEALPGGTGFKGGKLLYLVEGVCGTLKCPPYKSGWELTCAVCSFDGIE